MFRILRLIFEQPTKSCSIFSYLKIYIYENDKMLLFFSIGEKKKQQKIIPQIKKKFLPRGGARICLTFQAREAQYHFSPLLLSSRKGFLKYAFREIHK